MITEITPVFKEKVSQNFFSIRGVAIALVVIGHVIGYNLSFGMRQMYNSDIPVLGWLCDVINTFHMPIFFIAAGASFIIFSNKSTNLKVFFGSKIQKLVIPLIIWCPPYFILQSLTKGKIFDAIDVLKSVAFPYEIFWFLHVLIFTSIFCFLFFKLIPSSNLYFIVSVVLYIVVFVVNIGILQLYVFWNLFYAFGILIAQYLRGAEFYFNKQHSAIKILILIFFLSIMLTAQRLIPKDASIDYLRMINGIAGFTLLFFLASIFITRKHLRNSKLIRSIKYLGLGSMAVYLFHGYFTGPVKAIFMKFETLPHILYFVVASMLGILGPILVFYLLRGRSKLFLYSLGLGK